MTTVAGLSRALRRLARTVSDPKTKEALLALEEKVMELDTRLTDTERRLKAGGL